MQGLPYKLTCKLLLMDLKSVRTQSSLSKMLLINQKSKLFKGLRLQESAVFNQELAVEIKTDIILIPRMLT
jgi:hypothetical protein